MDECFKSGEGWSYCEQSRALSRLVSQTLSWELGPGRAVHALSLVGVHANECSVAAFHKPLVTLNALNSSVITLRLNASY